MNAKRQVIVHYHTFKNSGSSFDQLLSANYGDRHLTFDSPFPYTTFNQEELSKIIQRHTRHIAFSSHSIRLPVPTSLWIDTLAVVFVRHPILRVRSVYGFLKKNFISKQENQDANIDDTEHWAGQLDFDRWLTKMIESRNLHLLSNSQTQMFSGVYGTRGLTSMVDGEFQPIRISDLSQAKRNLAGVPLLARTEFYDIDIKHFSKILKPYGMTFDNFEQKPVNVTSDTIGEPISTRIQSVLNELSGSNARWLLKANQQDLSLYDYATALLESV